MSAPSTPPRGWNRSVTYLPRNACPGCTRGTIEVAGSTPVGSHPQDRAGHRARIAARPAAALDLMEEIGERLVEQVGLFEVQGVPGIREDDQRRGRDHPL